MTERLFINCNRAIVEAAILSGCRFFTGYPFTPATECLEQASHRMADAGGIYLQAESEVSVINMLMGAAAAGARCMTATSGAGFSLMQEGMSHMAGIAELPCVIVNVSRGGPGFGNLAPTQGDYFQATRGGGAGDYRCVVFGPGHVQEAVDCTKLAFHLADLVPDARHHPLRPDARRDHRGAASSASPSASRLPEKWWATTGCRGPRPHLLRAARASDYGPHAEYLSGNLTLNLIGLERPHREEDTFEAHMLRLAEKYGRIEAREVRAETVHLDDAELVVVAFRTAARLIRPGNRRGAGAGPSASASSDPSPSGPSPRRLVAEVAERARVSSWSSR